MGRVIDLQVTSLTLGQRALAAAAAVWLGAWLTFTHSFAFLQARRLSGPICPFYAITGHPCPFCGGTRSFASAWAGDWVTSIRHYPLGSILFAGSFAALVLLLAGALSGRFPVLRIKGSHWLAWTVLGLFSINWALKLFWLGY